MEATPTGPRDLGGSQHGHQAQERTRSLVPTQLALVLRRGNKGSLALILTLTLTLPAYGTSFPQVSPGWGRGFLQPPVWASAPQG